MAQKVYDDAIKRATPLLDSTPEIGTVRRPDGVTYAGYVKNGKWYGYGKIIYPGYSTFTGSFMNSEPEGFGKIEFKDEKSKYSEYFGFIKGYHPQGMGVAILKNGEKEYHTKWYYDSVWYGITFDNEKDPELLKIVTDRIENDAQEFVKRVDNITKGETDKNSNTDDSSWGLQNYGVAAAAALGVGAAGLYYSYNKSKKQRKKRSKKRSSRRHKKRSFSSSYSSSR